MQDLTLRQLLAAVRRTSDLLAARNGIGPDGLDPMSELARLIAMISPVYEVDPRTLARN